MRVLLSKNDDTNEDNNLNSKNNSKNKFKIKFKKLRIKIYKIIVTPGIAIILFLTKSIILQKIWKNKLLISIILWIITTVGPNLPKIDRYKIKIGNEAQLTRLNKNLEKLPELREKFFSGNEEQLQKLYEFMKTKNDWEQEFNKHFFQLKNNLEETTKSWNIERNERLTNEKILKKQDKKIQKLEKSIAELNQTLKDKRQFYREKLYENNLLLEQTNNKLEDLENLNEELSKKNSDLELKLQTEVEETRKLVLEEVHTKLEEMNNLVEDMDKKTKVRILLDQAYRILEMAWKRKLGGK